MNRLLYRRVPGEQIDAIEDAIIALRARLMTNDAAMMALIEQARRVNDRRPERRRLDPELALRAMPKAVSGRGAQCFWASHLTVPPRRSASADSAFHVRVRPDTASGPTLSGLFCTSILLLFRLGKRGQVT